MSVRFSDWFRISTTRGHSRPTRSPLRPNIPLKERQRKLREDWVLMRVATVVVVLAAAAVAVIFALMIAGYH
jgi:hypothetical protein